MAASVGSIVPPRARPRRGPRAPLTLALAVVAAAAAVALILWAGYRRAVALPPPTTPEGAYVRLVAAVLTGDVRATFACLDEPARVALEGVRAARKTARERVLAAYPEPERSRLAAEWGRDATAPDAATLWAALAVERGFVGRLRADLSGVASVEAQGDLAILTTARGTRYELRRAPDGAWGLSLFTPELVAAEERARRDAELVGEAARDYEHGR